MSGVWDSITATAQSIGKTLGAAARGLTVRFGSERKAPAEEELRIRIPRSPPRKPPTHPGPPRAHSQTRTARSHATRSHSASSRRRSATPENAAKLRRLQAEGLEPVVTEQPAARQMNRISIPIKQLMKLSHHGLGRRELYEVEGRVAQYFERSSLRSLLEFDADRDLHKDNWDIYRQALQNELVGASTQEFIRAGSAQMSPKGKEVYGHINEALDTAIATFVGEPIEKLLTFNPYTLPAHVYQGAFDATLEEILGKLSYEELASYMPLQTKMSMRVVEIYRRVMQAKRH
jgi:hypothetical protein